MWGSTFPGLDAEGNDSPIYEAASLGKPVFALLVLKMAELGILELDKTLISYAPEIISGDDHRLNDITGRMILSHSSGLSNFQSAGKNTLEFNPGGGFKYSGTGYFLLQQVLEKLTGESLESLARKHVFLPIGMSSSSFVWTSEMQNRIQVGLNERGVQLLNIRRPSNGNAAWSLYTTALDYSKFVAFMMGGTGANDPRRNMLKPAIQITDDISWGLGWSLQNTKPNPSFWHWGSNPGYRSYVVGYPKEGIGIVVLSNSENLFSIIEPLILETIGGRLPSFHWF